MFEDRDGMYGRSASQGGGGFMSDEFMGASEEPQKPRPQNCVPVSLKMITDTEGSGTFTIDGNEVFMVKVVAMIRSVNVQSTRITFLLDDSTAHIEAVQWIDTEAESEELEQQSRLKEMTYCLVVGKPRSQQGKMNLTVLKILPLTDLQMLTAHLIEVIHASLKMKQVTQMVNSADLGRPSMPSSSLSGSLVGAYSGKTAGLPELSTPGVGGGAPSLSNLVHKTILECPEEAGISRSTIYSVLGKRASSKEIDQMLDYLSGEGHIYSSIDEDHFKATDG